jgi:transposase-like protein
MRALALQVRHHVSRSLTKMMQERGVEVDASTIFRWVQR